MKTILNVVNRNDSPLRLLLEPWGREYELEAGAGQRFEFDGPDAGLIEVRTSPEAMAVYGWLGLSVNDGIEPEGPRVPHTQWSNPTRNVAERIARWAVIAWNVLWVVLVAVWLQNP